MGGPNALQPQPFGQPDPSQPQPAPDPTGPQWPGEGTGFASKAWDWTHPGPPFGGMGEGMPEPFGGGSMAGPGFGPPLQPAPQARADVIFGIPGGGMVSPGPAEGNVRPGDTTTGITPGGGPGMSMPIGGNTGPFDPTFDPTLPPVVAPHQIMGGQYGANNQLGLEDTGSAALSGTDNTYLAGLTLYSNPTSYQAWTDAQAAGVDVGPSWEAWRAIYGGAPAPVAG